jgi:uncharacterized membrane protein YfbV (UPF0208 family)
MTISERYRQIHEQLELEADRLYKQLPESATKALRLVDQAAEEFQEFLDGVGEIPQYQLEAKLSPVLLRAHGQLDRARVQLTNDEHEKAAELIWELEQLIYRLLNDL